MALLLVCSSLLYFIKNVAHALLDDHKNSNQFPEKQINRPKDFKKLPIGVSFCGKYTKFGAPNHDDVIMNDKTIKIAVISDLHVMHPDL